MNAEQRAALRKVAEEATPGPWVCKPHTCETIDDIDPGDDWTVYGANGQCVCFESIGRNECAQQNAKHIAAANPSTILQLLDYIETLEKDVAHKQAWIDALMLEFCPEEMTKEQVAEWVKHQVPAKGETE